MKVRFWGTRGSLPAPLTARAVEEKMRAVLRRAAAAGLAEGGIEAFLAGLPFELRATHGGNTSCVEIGQDDDPDVYVLCDAGTGIRDFGVRTMEERGGRPATYHIFLSHPHWDHIHGFPFLDAAYTEGNRVVVHGCHADLRRVFETQNSAPWFPVDFSVLGADIAFDEMQPGERRQVAGLSVTAVEQCHPGKSFAYRFEGGGRAVVYATDSEHKPAMPETTEPIVDFFTGADLLIFDAMYTFQEATTVKEDWGHSSNIMGVELAKRAGVRHLCLFHHDPLLDDARLATLFRETENYAATHRPETPLVVSMAYDGLEIDV